MINTHAILSKSPQTVLQGKVSNIGSFLPLSLKSSLLRVRQYYKKVINEMIVIRFSQRKYSGRYCHIDYSLTK